MKRAAHNGFHIWNELDVWNIERHFVQTVQAVQSLRSVQAPTSFLPRDAGEDEGGGLNGLNGLNHI